MTGHIHTDIWEGELTFAGLTLHCVVLDNGRLIIATKSLRTWAAWLENAATTKSDIERFASEFSAWTLDGRS